MGAQERLLVSKEGGYGRQQPGLPTVAHGHQHVAQETLVAGAGDSRTLEYRLPLLPSKLQPALETALTKTPPGMEGGRGDLARKAIPGADLLAIVATKDAVAQERAQGTGDGTLELDVR